MNMGENIHVYHLLPPNTLHGAGEIFVQRMNTQYAQTRLVSVIYPCEHIHGGGQSAANSLIHMLCLGDALRDRPARSKGATEGVGGGCGMHRWRCPQSPGLCSGTTFFKGEGKAVT